ncbi:MAG: hypothetical protein HOY78_29655 [Saccharothrix sp.]|nr:hypothetical protein [Saccharothrix sp.]
MRQVHESFVALGSAEPRDREVAAAELGDLLRGGGLDAATTERAVARLVEVAVEDSDRDVVEEALHAIGEVHEVPLRLVLPLTRRMPGWDEHLLDHALAILACTHDPAAKALVEAYADHPHPGVRRSAAEALVELPGRQVDAGSEARTS